MLEVIALASFLIAAAGGTFLTVRLAMKKELPSSVTILHGALGAVGLILLLIAALNKEAFGLAAVALATFVMAAIGGFANLLVHLTKGRPYLPVALIHGVVAIIGAGILVFAIVQGSMG